MNENFFNFYTKKGFRKCLVLVKWMDSRQAATNTFFLHCEMSKGLMVELAGCSPQKS